MIRFLPLHSCVAGRGRFFLGDVLRSLLFSVSLVGLPVAAVTEGTPEPAAQAPEDEDPVMAQRNRELVQQGFDKRRVDMLLMLLKKPTTTTLVMERLRRSEDEALKVAITMEVLRDVFLWKSPRVHPRSGSRVDVAEIARMIDPVIRTRIPDYGSPKELREDERLRSQVSQKLLEQLAKTQNPEPGVPIRPEEGKQPGAGAVNAEAPATPVKAGAASSGEVREESKEASFSPLKEVVERGRGDFSFEALLRSLGAKMTPEMTARLEAEAQRAPGMDETFGEGVKLYVLGLDGNGSTVLHTVNGILAAFSYASKEPDAGRGDGAEAVILQEFKAADEMQVEALNAVFNTVSFPVRKYGHRERGGIESAAYVHAQKRVVIFLDVSKIQLSKLLPRIPEKEMVEKMKKILQESQGK